MATSSVRGTHVPAPQPEALLNDFVRRVATLPQVREVPLVDSGQEWLLRTLIEAEPFDRSAREPVYQTQLATPQDHPATDVSFCLINLAEYPDVPVDELVPTH